MRQYKQHNLRGNKGSQRPHNILFLDVETRQRTLEDEQHHYFDLGWTCYVQPRSKGRNTVSWRFHNDPFELWKYADSLVKPKKTLWVIGHNVFFDLQSSDFFNYFTKWGWSLEFTYDQGLTYILVIRKDYRTIKVLSTTNFYPFSLKKLGEFLGLPKLDVSFESSSREELSTYCKRDVEICKAIFENWIAFIDSNDLGNFALTRASQAFTAYRHRFMPKSITINDEKDIKDWERNAYFGGRTECFQIGKIDGGPFVTLDVNSMYPYVMKNNKYPVRFLSYSDCPRHDLIEYNLAHYAVVAEIEVETEEPAYCIINDGKLIFPIGSFTCWVCTRGLSYAIRKGHLKRIKQIAYYEKEYIFADYIDYFMGLKTLYSQQNNHLMRQTAKIFLNALYGKFGQKKPITIEEESVDEKGYWKEEIADLVSGEMLTVTQLFNTRFATYGKTSSTKSFPAIAAHITEDARFHLWDIITSIGRNKVLYSDTDSVKIRKKDLPFVDYPMDNDKLGALKNEGEDQELTIYGPKDYETESCWKAKGVPKSAERIGPGQFKYNEFPRQNTHLRAKNPRYYIVKSRIKYLEREYNKGTVLEDGQVIPFRF